EEEECFSRLLLLSETKLFRRTNNTEKLIIVILPAVEKKNFYACVRGCQKSFFFLKSNCRQERMGRVIVPMLFESKCQSHQLSKTLKKYSQKLSQTKPGIK
ncbi:MAG TPA: hypothetical protein VJ044_15395, partial [Candidatus Hodarchaeales archaeon]|nr:hypothetical protein [Candidatus Hodarchaeales archaeon]